MTLSDAMRTPAKRDHTLVAICKYCGEKFSYRAMAPNQNLRGYCSMECHNATRFFVLLPKPLKDRLTAAAQERGITINTLAAMMIAEYYQ